jgi:glutathione S-transferase
MCFEQYSHEPNVATLRFWHVAKLLATKTPAEIEAKRTAGNAALAIMDAQLATRAYFVGERFTIADIALFAYTHVASEGGFELARFPHVQRWIARVEAQPGYVPITHDFGVPASPLPS